MLLILIAGTAIRLYQVGDVPPGLYRDEAFYGLDALGILRGDLAVYFTANNGREGLFMYLLAGSISVLGRNPIALRIVAALCGSLTLLAIYLAGRHLFSHRIGVLSAGILAGTFWHVALSRVAYRAITLPLMLCVTIALAAWLAQRLRRGDAHWSVWLHAGLLGAACGLTFYTYTSASLLVVLALAVALVAAIYPQLRSTAADALRRPQTTRVLLLTAGTVLVVLLPMLIWLTHYGDLYFLRAGQVSILNPAINQGDMPGALWQNIQKTIGMFAYQGDRIWRHNLSQLPVFDGLLATTFFIGVVVCVWRFVLPAQPHRLTGSSRRLSALVLVLWLAVFLVPTVIAEDTPHYLRAIGALPAACLISAVGFEALVAWFSRRGLLAFYRGGSARFIGPPALLAALVLVLSGVGTVNRYFNVYARMDMTGYWLEQHNVKLAREVNAYTATHDSASLWLQDRLANDNPALRFLSPAVDDERVTRVGDGTAEPSPPAEVFLLVDPNHAWTTLLHRLPTPARWSVTVGPLAQGDLEAGPRTAYIGVLAKTITPTQQAAVGFEQGIELQGVQIEAIDWLRSSNQLPLNIAADEVPRMTAQYTVTLFWRTQQPIPTDYAVFVHVWRAGAVVGQHDSSPAQNYLPMPTWRPSDEIADSHLVRVPGMLQDGDEIRVGVYKREDGVRLRVHDLQGVLAGDSVVVARVAASP